LLELSRQRLNPSLMEAQFQKCEHCEGVGTVKTLDFAAITAMRAIEEEGIKNNVAELSLNVPNNVAVYILNNKRSMLADIEKRYDFRVHIRTDDDLMPSEFRLDIMKGRDGEPLVEKPKPQKNTRQNKNQKQKQNQNQNHNPQNSEDSDGQHPKKKSRRRGRRGGRKNNRNNNPDGVNNDQQDNNTPSKTEMHDANQKQVTEKKSKSDANSEPDVKESKTTPQKKKPAAKKPKKDTKSQVRSDSKASSKKPSNDVSSPVIKDEPKPYETVNKEPSKKKKGWWNRLVD